MGSDRSVVARRIEEIRVAKKLSRKALGKSLGVSYLQVYRLEKGLIGITADTAADVAEVLGVTVASLYREGRAA